MVAIGYSLMTEQRSPVDIVADAQLAEQAGFDFATISDHYHPWIEAQGHSGFCWSMLGAISQVTSRLPVTTYVTAPIIRYHPAVIAQAAATMATLMPERFRLGLGSGENLNEHVVGGGFPANDVRQEILEEAVEIIRELWQGDYVTYRGQHFDVERARVFDLPDRLPDIGIAAGGPQAAELAASAGDFLITTVPDPKLIQTYEKAAGPGHAIVGQTPVCWAQDEQGARKTAHKLQGWTVAGWKVQTELVDPESFQEIADQTTEEQVAETVPSGPDLDQIVDAVKQYVDAGFTEIAITQVGPDQQGFCDIFHNELGPKLRKL
ncbi:MAG: TIGR03557 family F420-dependent LLM class oxidoreductase [Thermomicrobiales bacterium]|nr:TIGR03557 family F420-dependent LLM class oxidoreductase [Thermomicrobiales bacterium]MCO5221724.1 TIGR03557 family F420-dependent LLM class oxidoreductase [Thermomicrobiales bacterium]